jgi:cytochrome c
MTAAIKNILLIAVFAMVAIGKWTDNAVAQSINPAPFTQAQADAGRQGYLTSCASCHNEDLSGKGAPALAGKAFIASNFGQHTVAELYGFIQKSMPFCEGGSLAAESYTDIVAFILEANGAKPGDQPLTPATSVKVSDIATGDMPAGFQTDVTPK